MKHRPYVHESNKMFLVIMSPLQQFPRAAYSRARGPGFDIRSGHILSFPLSLIQEGQLSTTDKIWALSTG